MQILSAAKLVGLNQQISDRDLLLGDPGFVGPLRGCHAHPGCEQVGHVQDWQVQLAHWEV